LSVKEPAMADLQEKPAYFHDYIAILQGQRITMGPCFAFPVRPKHSEQVVRIDRGNAELLQGGFEWALSEVDYAQPFVALVCDGKAVSICRSVRITPQAHEAGLETLEAYRGRGYASSAAAGWAAAVRERGALPLYSTSWDNAASRSVAKKLGLILYGAAFTLA
jgi:RimJ/RimL family protein N-acetyltransferase